MDKLLKKLEKGRKYFNDTMFESIVEEAEQSYLNNDYRKCYEALKKLPDEREMLSDLVESLKGKSVYKTLKKIVKEERLSNADLLKGLFSLGTHTIIEMQTNKHYRALLPLIYERIGAVLHKGL